MFSTGLPKVVVIGVIGLAFSASACAQPLPRSAAVSTPARAAGPVEAAVAEFVQAFTSLDEVRFDAAWTEDATLFFPLPVPGSGGGRFTGKENVLNVFHRFFASVRSRKSGPDYLNIKPEDMHIQNYGDTAIVTFDLTGDQGIARRPLVMRRHKRVWRVAHMHASNMSLPPAIVRKPAAQ
jgi:ketosteroid isomerase-like protein